jgi:RHS repeat-associated protein
MEVHTYYVHPDHLGTPQRLTDRHQQIVWDAVYAPFGEVTLRTEQVIQPLRFPGQYADPETGLHPNWHRDYDPALGRYLQSDPIGLSGGINTYAYVGSNPIRYTDPTGLEIFVCGRGVQGFPFVGNHAYTWDSTTNSAEGMRGSSGRGQASNEKGPQRSDNPDGDTCNKVEGSSGKEAQVMDFMRQNANNGIWFPFVNDCHNAINDALKNAGLENPGAPGGRFGGP